MASNYKLVKKLGSGSFGTTYLAEDTTGRSYAVKKISFSKLEMVGGTIDDVYKEIDNLKRLNKRVKNDYIIRYIDSYQDNVKGEDYINIVMEYAKGQTLDDYILEHKGDLPPTVLWPIMLQLIMGLKSIHDAGFAHRDIKPGNIMIDDFGQIKYIDFGLACKETCNLFGCRSDCNNKESTILYIPPEGFSNQGRPSLSMSKAHDIWSLVLVMYELSGGIGVLPFDLNDSMNSQDIIDSILLAPTRSPEYKNDDGRTNVFLVYVTRSDVNSRPNITELLTIFRDDILCRVYQSLW